MFSCHALLSPSVLKWIALSPPSVTYRLYHSLPCPIALYCTIGYTNHLLDPGLERAKISRSGVLRRAGSMVMIAEAARASSDRIDWDTVRGLMVDAIYGGRLDNPHDLRVLVTYLRRFFYSDVVSVLPSPTLACLERIRLRSIWHRWLLLDESRKHLSGG